MAVLAVVVSVVCANMGCGEESDSVPAEDDCENENGVYVKSANYVVEVVVF